MWIHINEKKEENETLIEQLKLIKSFCNKTGIDLVKDGLEVYKQSKEFKDKMEILKAQLNM